MCEPSASRKYQISAPSFYGGGGPGHRITNNTNQPWPGAVNQCGSNVMWSGNTSQANYVAAASLLANR